MAAAADEEEFQEVDPTGRFGITRPCLTRLRQEGVPQFDFDQQQPKRTSRWRGTWCACACWTPPWSTPFTPRCASSAPSTTTTSSSSTRSCSTATPACSTSSPRSATLRASARTATATSMSPSRLERWAHQIQSASSTSTPTTLHIMHRDLNCSNVFINNCGDSVRGNSERPPPSSPCFAAENMHTRKDPLKGAPDLCSHMKTQSSQCWLLSSVDHYAF